MPLAGPELTPLQVVELCYKHGIDPDAGQGLNIVNAMCVCWGESSLFAGAWNFNETSGDHSYGLWQINMIGALAAERRLKYGITDDTQLFDPDVNCKIMVDMSNKGANFKPWGAYTSGSYRAALGTAVTARATLLKSLNRPVTSVPIPPDVPVPLVQRSWVSFKQIKAAGLSMSGVIKTASGDSSRDDVANYQRGLWKLLPGLDYIYDPGIYNAKTKKATAQFQRQQGWTGTDADGIVGPVTLRLVEAQSQLFRARDF